MIKICRRQAIRAVRCLIFQLIHQPCDSRKSGRLRPQDPFSQSDWLNSRLRGKSYLLRIKSALRADENSDLLSGSCAFDELFRLWHSFRQLVGHQFQIHFRSRFHRLHITHNRCHRGDHATLTLLGCCLRNSVPPFDFCIRFFLIQLDPDVEGARAALVGSLLQPLHRDLQLEILLSFAY